MNNGEWVEAEMEEHREESTGVACCMVLFILVIVFACVGWILVSQVL